MPAVQHEPVLFNRRWLRIAFYGCLLVMSAFVAAAVYLINREHDSEEWVLHTLEVLGQIERLHQTLLEAESTGRAYLVNGNREVLLAYRRRAGSIDTELQRLLALMGESAGHQQHASRLILDIGERFSHLDRILVLRDKGGVEAVQLQRSRPGIDAMGRVSDRLEQMKLQQRQALSERKARNEAHERELLVLLTAAAVVSLTIIGTLFGRIQKLWAQCAEAQREARHQSRHDSLTGLPNRRLIVDRLDIAIAQAKRQNHFVGVLYLDLDGFKAVNDEHGHAAGDDVLRTVAQRLARFAREEDRVGRLGGDEFVIVLGRLVTPTGAVAMAERVIDAIAAPIVVHGQTALVGASLGVAIYPEHGASSAELLAYADAALFRAKRAGRGRFELVT